MLPAPELCQGNRRGAGQGSRRSGEEERHYFESLSSPLPPTTCWEGRGAAVLPQGSSFAMCKAELFGDKRAIWKTVVKTAGGFDRLVDTKLKEQARLPQHSSCMGDIPTARDTTHFCSTLRWGVGRSHSSWQGVRLPTRLQSLVHEPNSASTRKTNRRERYLHETSG